MAEPQTCTYKLTRQYLIHRSSAAPVATKPCNPLNSTTVLPLMLQLNNQEIAHCVIGNPATGHRNLTTKMPTNQVTIVTTRCPHVATGPHELAHEFKVCLKLSRDLKSPKFGRNSPERLVSRQTYNSVDSCCR